MIVATNKKGKKSPEKSVKKVPKHLKKHKLAESIIISQKLTSVTYL